MKFYLLLFIPFILSAQIYDYTYGLEFPSNGDAPSDAFVAFQFDNPQNDGLPIWGPNHEGVTWIWEYKPYQQTGYYVTFWWSNGLSNDTYIFIWDNGSTDTYYGGHPYPQNHDASGTTHYWELAGTDDGADYLNTKSGGPLTVVKNEWYLQSFQVKVNGNGTKDCAFYIDLPDLANNKIIENTATAQFGEKLPPHPKITYGDSPWYRGFQHERLSGILGRIKIIDTVMTTTQILEESADMSKLVTNVAKRNIWWGINNFENVDDLTCDYGTGRSFYWAEPQNKAKLIVIDSVLATGATDPVFSPEAGTYMDSVSVVITSQTPEASIYYTDDDSSPTESSSLYTNAITITDNTTIKARAYKDGLNPSSVSSAQYIINQTGQTIQPQFSPGAGTYEDSVTVTISSQTSDAVIYYAFNENTPSEVTTLYSGPITIKETTTLKARAFKDEFNPSQITSAQYTIIYVNDISVPDNLKPGTFALKQNYPNPFNPVTVITYSLAVGSKTLLKVYNSEGKVIKTLVNAYQSAGEHQVNFDGSDLNSGVYFYVLKSAGQLLAEKMILIK